MASTTAPGILLRALTLASLLFSSSSAKQRLFILAGQSNMSGQASWAGAELPDSTPGVRIWSTSGSPARKWTTLRPGFGEDSSKFGPEMSLGSTLHSTMPHDTLHIIKATWSGTDLATCWKPNLTAGLGTCHRLMDAAIDSARAQLSSPPKAIDGFFWMQGESDALIQASAEAYHDNFSEFVDHIRHSWGDSTFPIISGLIDIQPCLPFAPIVRDAVARVSDEREKMGYVETVGLGTDGLHYTAEGLQELGRELAQRWIEVSGKGNEPSPALNHHWWSFRSPGYLLLWVPEGTSDLEYRMLGVDGATSPWTRCPVPLMLPRSRIKVGRSTLLQLRDSRGNPQNLRIPLIWR